MKSLLLAGGRSSRMGRDKALIEVGGVACIARVASALAAAGCEPIRIAVAPVSYTHLRAHETLRYEKARRITVNV